MRERVGRKLLMVAAALGLAGLLPAWGSAALPRLRSASVLVQDQHTGEVLLQKRVTEALPIASLTKLVTAMVVLDANLNPNETLTILEEDKDTLRFSRSRLPVGTQLTRDQALLLALMASENRAAHALGRTYPGGLSPFLAAMNAKAAALGLKETRFFDPTGLSGGNVSSAMDLARIVDAAHHYPRIRSCTTQVETEIQGQRMPLRFHNTNLLVASPRWQIGLSKTGFIDESGQCLVMQAQLANRPLLIVLLDASGRHSRFDDANRIRQWLVGPDPVAPRQVRVSRRLGHRAKPGLNHRVKQQVKHSAKRHGSRRAPQRHR